MADSKHDQIAKDLAKKEGTKYNKGKGPDVKGDRRVIEVATHESDLYSSLDQLKRFRKPKYIATGSDLIDKAKEVTKRTGIGVMGPSGSIEKKSRGKAKAR